MILQSFNTNLPKEGQRIVVVSRDRKEILTTNYFEELYQQYEVFPDGREVLGWVDAQEVLDNLPTGYDKSIGDDTLCLCGHPYYRHFDTYEDMRPTGCKYCYAYGDTRKQKKKPNSEKQEDWSCCNGFEIDPNPNNTGCSRCDEIQGRTQCVCDKD